MILRNNKKIQYNNAENTITIERDIINNRVVFNEDTGRYNVYDFDGKFLKEVDIFDDFELEIYKADPYYQPHDPAMTDSNNFE